MSFAGKKYKFDNKFLDYIFSLSVEPGKLWEGREAKEFEVEDG